MAPETSSLESLCELIVDCPHSTPKWTDQGVLVLRNQNIKNGSLDLSSPSYTDEEGYRKRIKRARPQPGDIVFTREAPMGEVCMIPDGLKCCLGQRQVLLRPKTSVSRDYLFWALQSPYVQNQISWNEGTGTTVSNVRIPVLKSLQIPRQSTGEEKIGKILNSFASKIQKNGEISHTLEQVAHALFKSWFVDFEPVKAKMATLEAGGTAGDAERAAMQAISGKSETQLDSLRTQNPEQHDNLARTAALFPSAMIESELGAIPEGWQAKKLSEMTQLIGGGTPKKSQPEYWNGEICWFSVKDAPSPGDVFVVDTEAKITELGLQKSSAKILPVGTTIISARGTVGKLALTGREMAMNQSCYGAQGVDPIGPCLNYLNLKRAVDKLKRNVHGAVFDTITRDTFKTVSLVQAPNNVMSDFERIVTPFFNKIKTNMFEVQALTATRDTLLPKLLSGELNLSELEISQETPEPADV